MTNKRIIIVNGMHRSGTSALTGVLYKSGCYIGNPDTLLQADPSNEQGYFEQQEVLAINQHILNSLVFKRLQSNHEFNEFLKGTHMEEADLEGPAWILGAWLNKEDFMEISPEVERRISIFLEKIWNDNEGHQPILLKDPRFSITLPLWQRYLQNPVVIMLIRHPAAVARSLWKRDRIFMPLGFELWFQYTEAAMLNSKDHTLYIIDYDQLLASPQRVLGRLFAWLRTQDINVGDENLELSQKFLNIFLRHQIATADTGIPDHISCFYRQILESIPTMPAISVADQDSVDIDKIWNSLTYLVLLRTTQRLTHENDILRERCKHLLSRMVRVNRHPVSGPLLRFLRFVKRDNTFGQQD